MAKLSQVIQNFHTKAALIVLHSRVELSPAYAKGTNAKRVNKWFNVELDETEDYKDDIRLWKTCDATDHRPPPLIIEIYLDTKGLTNNQSLVIMDENGKRWDVMEALASSFSARTAGRSALDSEEVVLERWTIELGGDRGASTGDLNVVLPIVYKKGIVLFRSLFTLTRFLPAWKFSRQIDKLRSNSQLRLKYRIRDRVPASNSSGSDSLTAPLCASHEKAVEDFSFGVTESPAGPFSIKVTYRTNCDFRVDDAEALLSSRFMGADDEFFRPSLPKEESSRPTGPEVGSLPVRNREVQRPDRSQAYGSLSTFHQVGPATGSSPLSALRNVHSPDSPPVRPAPSHRSSTSSRSSLRTEGMVGVARRPSVSFQPFKGPTLSASPAPSLGTSPRISSGRVPGLSPLSEARGIPPTQTPSAASVARKHPEQAIASSTSSSPKPAPITRYSSSFSHRRARLSSGGPIKTDDDQNSSGKGSATSSAQPGSGLMAEVPSGSSGSVQEDDENISDFLKMLDTKKDLLTPSTSAGIEASTKRTSAALTRFHRMRDSNAVLSESMSSSMMLHRSSSSSSRQLSSVPPMVPGTSISTSSSPGKPLSPHTPHTPAIPSRLSANSIIDYNQPATSDGRRTIVNESPDNQSEAVASEGTTTETANANAGAIDIPTSPRPFAAAYRRSSSLAHRRAANVEEDVTDFYGMRGASLGAEDRPLPTMSTLVRQQEAENTEEEGSQREVGPTDDSLHGTSRRPTLSDRRSSLEYRRYGPQNAPPGDGSNSASGSASGASSIHQVYRSRLTRGGGRGHTPHGSASSVGLGGVERPESAGSETWSRRGGRTSFSRPDSRFDEDETFLFAMSDLGMGGPSNTSRRSLEEARGGEATYRRGSGNGRRGGSGSGSGGNYAPWS